MVPCLYCGEVSVQLVDFHGRKASPSVRVDPVDLLRKLEEASGERGRRSARGRVHAEGRRLVFTPTTEVIAGPAFPEFIEQRLPFFWQVTLDPGVAIEEVDFEAFWNPATARDNPGAVRPLILLGRPFLVERNEAASVWQGRVRLRIPLEAFSLERLHGHIEIWAYAGQSG